MLSPSSGSGELQALPWAGPCGQPTAFSTTDKPLTGMTPFEVRTMHLFPPRLGLVLAGLIVCLAAFNPALVAQKGALPNKKTNSSAFKADISKKGPTLKYPASRHKVNKRAAIAHKPFQAVHPKTGKALNPAEMLTLPNGKKMKTSDYYAQLNDLEKKLNSHGHSLRNTAKKVVLGETQIDKARLAKQVATLNAKHRAFNAKTMRRPTAHKDLAAAHRAAVNKLRAALGSKTKTPNQGSKTKTPAQGSKTRTPAPGKKTKAPTQGVNTEQEDLFLTAADTAGAKGKSDHELRKLDGLKYGDEAHAQVFVDGQWETTVSPDVVDFKGEAVAGVVLVNHRIELLKATASAHAGGGSDGSAKINVSVLGASIYNFNQVIKTTFEKSDAMSKSVDYAVTVPIPITPIPVPLVVKMGARGTVGIKYVFGVSAVPLLANVQVVPNASIDLFAQVGIDIKLADAGVEGKLTLLNFALTLGVEAGVKSDGGAPKLSLFVHGDSETNMLAGDISFFADIPAPAADKKPPFEKKRHSHSFFSNKGYTKQGSLFNVQRSTPLPALPAPATAKPPAAKAA
jgi:hypothetical protein